MGSKSSRSPPTSDSIVFLLWLQRSHPLYRSLSPNILREVSCYLCPSVFLVDVQPQRMRWFDVEERKWSRVVKLQSRVEVCITSRWVVLGDGKVLCCGGGGDPRLKISRPARTAYELGREGTVQELPRMLKARGSHGLIEWRASVLVFGGSNCYAVKQKLLTACECLQLRRTKRWQSLPHMHSPRSNFNPCIYHAVIYLCGFGSNEIEAFHPQKKCYLQLNLQLPETSACCLYSVCDVLVVHSSQYGARYRLNAEGVLEELQRAPRQGSCMKYQQSQPVVVEREVVWGVWDGKCWEFCMKTGRKSSLY